MFKNIVNRLMTYFKVADTASFINQTKLIVSLIINYGYYTREIPFKFNYKTSNIEFIKCKSFKTIQIILRMLTFITTCLNSGNLIYLLYSDQFSKKNPVNMFHAVAGSLFWVGETLHGFNILRGSDSCNWINKIMEYFYELESMCKSAI